VLPSTFPLPVSHSSVSSAVSTVEAVLVEAAPVTDVPKPFETSPSQMRSPGKRFYAVVNGIDGFSGVLDNWECASLVCMGVSRSTVKRYPSREEAQAAVDTGLAMMVALNSSSGNAASEASGAGSH